jgi:tetratricopeptide (TPR) repeat protein
MMPNLQFALNQQFQQGCYMAQQAALAEQMGNLQGAVQCFDQAILLIGNTVSAAAQAGIPVLDNVFFSHAYCQFNAARVKAMAGWPQAAPMHLAQALQSMNQAIQRNPGFAPYHAAAGMVLAAQGNVVEAVRAFQQAVQLNPADAWSQWMLASLASTQGNTVAANQYYAAAMQTPSNLPPPQQFVQQFQQAPAQGGGAKGHDWFELVNNALKFGNTVAGLFDQGGGQQGMGAAAGWGGQNWGGGGQGWGW